MGWEQRNSNRYYYRKRWQNGTCVSEYVGTGSLAETIATLEQLDQEQQRLTCMSWQQVQIETEAFDRQINELCAQIRTVTRAVLIATGHHRHKGQWRKKRMSEQKMDDNQINKFLKKLQTGKGKKEDVEGFKQAIKEVPEVLKLFDLTKIAQGQTLNNLSGDNQALELANKQLLKDIKQGLGYDDSSQLERLLIEQIILCHIRLYWVENLMTTNLKGSTSKQVQYWEQRLSVNQRRYFRAIETLARVRKLASRTPEILMVNIAEKQVNQVTQ